MSRLRDLLPSWPRSDNGGPLKDDVDELKTHPDEVVFKMTEDDDLEIDPIRTDTVSIDVEHYMDIAENVELKGAVSNDDLRELVERMYESEKELESDKAAHLIKWRNELEELIDDE